MPTCNCGFQGKMFRSKRIDGVKVYTCQRCAAREDAAKRERKPRTPIKKVSDKRAKQIREYAKQREKEPQPCAFPGCKKIGSERHHKGGREGDKLTDKDNQVYICPEHHRQITKDSLLGIKLNLSTWRNRKAS